MNGLCDYPKCKREATRFSEEVESCDGSASIEIDLCEKHYQEAVRYGAECEEKELENAIKDLILQLGGKKQA